MRQALVSAPSGSAYTPLPRMLSLLLAMTMAGMILTYPQALIHASHGLLSLTMLGVSAGFVHGVGFVPESKLWRVLFGPWLAWPLMGQGLWLVLAGS